MTSYHLMLTSEGVLAFGFGSGLIFLVSTPQGDASICFTYLSGIKKIITLKRKPLLRTSFIQTSPLWKVNNSGFNTAPDPYLFRSVLPALF